MIRICQLKIILLRVDNYFFLFSKGTFDFNNLGVKLDMNYTASHAVSY